MKQIRSILNICLILIFLSLNACKSKTTPDTSSITTDSTSIVTGENIFSQNCSGCHNFKQDGIGPQLGGITSSVSAEWIKKFIKNPKLIIESGDERSKKLFEKYNSIMPSFASYSDDDLNKIVAYLHSKKSSGPSLEKGDTSNLKNPIPEPIALSNLVIDLLAITQIPPSDTTMPRTRITKLDFQPSTDHVFILDLRGKLYTLKNNKPVVYMDMAKLRPKFIHKPGLATGFGSFAFHPDFQKNGLLYTTHSEPTGSAKADYSYADSIKVTVQWVLTEWKTKQPKSFPFSGESRELLRINFVSGIHGAQEITFNPTAKKGDDDYALLFMGIGDGGSVENGFQFLAHSIEKVWGTILRIDPSGSNSINGKYGIPKTNPFVKNNNANALGEIYAYGFRNPHRITWSTTGQMLCVNVGHKNIESLNLIASGNDYGWPVREGTFLLNPFGDMEKIYPLPPNDAMNHVTYPVAQYDHDEGKAITGGYEYWGLAVPELKGKFLFGDIPTGRLFYVEMKDIKQGKQAPIKEWQISINGQRKKLEEVCGSKRVDLHFGRDAKGELYILTKPDGKVYKLTSSNATL